jgi:Zn-dependent peptidase ImmA (M78 family)
VFPRGFKTWAEQTSARARQQLKLSSISPLDPFALAGVLDVYIMTPDDLSDLPAKVRRRLLTEFSDHWSAITVMSGNHHLIVTNSAHASTRRNSSLAHELAHIILGHEPSLMFMTPKSGLALRTHNDEQEEQANWLAGALLLPRDALVAIRRSGTSDERACREYGVSSAMLKFRMNVSGVNVQLRRWGTGRRR